MICGGNPVFLFIEIVRAFENADNHTFEKLTKCAKLQYFEPFYFSKVEKRNNRNLSHCNISLLYLIQQK